MAFGLVVEGLYTCSQPYTQSSVLVVGPRQLSVKTKWIDGPITHSNSTHSTHLLNDMIYHLAQELLLQGLCCACPAYNIACVILPSSILYLQLSVTSPRDYIITSDLSIFSPCFSIWNYSRNKNRRTRIWPAQFFSFCVIYIYTGFVQWWMGSGSTNPSDRIYPIWSFIVSNPPRLLYITYKMWACQMLWFMASIVYPSTAAAAAATATQCHVRNICERVYAMPLLCTQHSGNVSKNGREFLRGASERAFLTSSDESHLWKPSSTTSTIRVRLTISAARIYHLSIPHRDSRIK